MHWYWYKRDMLQSAYFSRLFKAFVNEKPTYIKGRRGDSNGCTLFWRASCPAWDLGKISQKYSKINQPQLLRGTQLNPTRILAPCTLSDKATWCVSQPIKSQRKHHDEGRQVLAQSGASRQDLSSPADLPTLFSVFIHCFASFVLLSPSLPSFSLAVQPSFKKEACETSGNIFILQLYSTAEKRARFVWLLRFRSTSCFLLFWAKVNHGRRNCLPSELRL